MYGLFARMTAVPGRREELVSLLRSGSGTMAGCLSYVVADDAQDPNALWITEVWRSREDHRAALQRPEVKQAIERGRPLIASIDDRVETVPMGGVMLEAHAPGTGKPRSEHQRLQDFAGEWRVEGRNLDGAPDKPGEAVSGHSAFHWLPGQFFLFGRETVSFGGQTHVTLMVFAFHADAGEYRACFFDNTGFSRVYAGQFENRTWRFTGRYERVRIEASEDGSRLRHYWERTEDGNNWMPLCELTSHRID